jgi:hypothetical protein
MADDITYEIQVRKNGNWVRFGLTGSPQLAEQNARAALNERKYLDAYKIVCERRDGKSGKINKIAFPPVLRTQLDAAADQEWERHVLGKPAADPPPRRKAVPPHYSWVLPVILLLIIMWGGYFALAFVRQQIFAK